MSKPDYKPRNDRSNLTSRYRLREFDYSTPGYYFLTLPINNRLELLGEIEDFNLHLSEFGGEVLKMINACDGKFPHLSIEQFTIMPNHVHLLIYLSIDNVSTTSSDLVKWLKGASTAAYRKGVRAGAFMDVGPKIWQVGFNDEIVRSETHLHNVRNYMENNVAKWTEDELNAN